MRAILLAVVLFLPAHLAVAGEGAVVGTTYPIAEKDLLDQIKETVAATDWDRMFNLDTVQKAFKDYRPEHPAPPLPAAAKASTFKVDLTYQTEFDIPDGKGGILYPKGFVFNPLDFVAWKNTLVVIDGENANQVAWAAKEAALKDTTVKLLITRGRYWELALRLHRPVYFADKPIIDKFKIKALPSIVRQVGNLMEVSEVGLNVPKKNN